MLVSISGLGKRGSFINALVVEVCSLHDVQEGSS
jgi:hypothetical protein